MTKFLKVFLYILILGLIIIPVLIWYFWRQDYYGSIYLKHVSEIDGCTPYDFLIDVKSPTIVELSWKTKDECSTYIKLEPGEHITTRAQVIYSIDGNLPQKEHHFTLGGLTPNKVYSLIVVAGSFEYGIDGDVIHLRLGDR